MAKKPKSSGKGSNRRPLVAFRIGEVTYQQALEARPTSPYGPQDPMKLSSWDMQQIFDAGIASLANQAKAPGPKAQLSTRKPKRSKVLRKKGPRLTKWVT